MSIPIELPGVHLVVFNSIAVVVFPVELVGESKAGLLLGFEVHRAGLLHRL